MRHSDLIKLNRILGMLGSDHAGERAAAGLAADRLVKALGTTWWTLLSGGLVPPAPPARTVASIRTHELGIDHARAAESRIRQLRAENDLLRKEVSALKNRLSNLTAQERRASIAPAWQASEHQA